MFQIGFSQELQFIHVFCWCYTAKRWKLVILITFVSFVRYGRYIVNIKDFMPIWPLVPLHLFIQTYVFLFSSFVMLIKIIKPKNHQCLCKICSNALYVTDYNNYMTMHSYSARFQCGICWNTLYIIYNDVDNVFDNVYVWWYNV